MDNDVLIREVGIREGFQNIAQVFPTEVKIDLARRIASSGVKEIEVVSFVRKDRVPQMADAEEVLEGLKSIKDKSDIRWRGIYLNIKGLERAAKCPSLHLEGWVPIAMCDEFLRRNSNTTFVETLNKLPDWFDAFSTVGISFHGILLSTCFGSNYKGEFRATDILQRINAIISSCRQHKQFPHELSLADTMGWGSPKQVKEVVSAIKERYPDLTISLHLHDTRGLGVANAYAGYLAGVRIFESSIGGLGGCPFVPNAAGNVATEELVYMFHRMGVRTGIELDVYKKIIRYMKTDLKLNITSKLGNLWLKE